MWQARPTSSAPLRHAAALIVAGDFSYGNEIPWKFRDGDGWDEHSAAERWLLATADLLEATGLVTDGLAYLTSEQQLSLLPDAYIAMINRAYKHPHEFASPVRRSA